MHPQLHSEGYIAHDYAASPFARGSRAGSEEQFIDGQRKPVCSLAEVPTVLGSPACSIVSCGCFGVGGAGLYSAELTDMRLSSPFGLPLSGGLHSPFKLPYCLRPKWARPPWEAVPWWSFLRPDGERRVACPWWAKAPQEEQPSFVPEDVGLIGHNHQHAAASSAFAAGAGGFGGFGGGVSSEASSRSYDTISRSGIGARPFEDVPIAVFDMTHVGLGTHLDRSLGAETRQHRHLVPLDEALVSMHLWEVTLHRAWADGIPADTHTSVVSPYTLSPHRNRKRPLGRRPPQAAAAGCRRRLPPQAAVPACVVAPPAFPSRFTRCLQRPTA